MTSPHQQKIKVTGPVVVTANRLEDGVVVYRTAARGWSTALSDALVLTTAADASRVLAEAKTEDAIVVEAYVAPVELTTDAPVTPGNLRERIRRDGPTFPLPGSGI
jgi:hypothetical protein